MACAFGVTSTDRFGGDGRPAAIGLLARGHATHINYVNYSRNYSHRVFFFNFSVSLTYILLDLSLIVS